MLAYNPDSSLLKRVNLLELKGNSPLNLTKFFNNAQKAAYDSLEHTPEITLIHGLFRTGKTTLNITYAVEIISNLATPHKVLYLVNLNTAVNNVAL